LEKNYFWRLLFSGEPDLSIFATKEEVDNLTQDDIEDGEIYVRTENNLTDDLKSNYDSAYSHSEITDGTNPHATIFANIEEKPTTLEGYGITDGYTKTETDGLLDTKEPLLPVVPIEQEQKYLSWDGNNNKIWKSISSQYIISNYDSTYHLSRLKAKYGDDQIHKACKLWIDGYNIKEINTITQVDTDTLYNITKGFSWKRISSLYHIS